MKNLIVGRNDNFDIVCVYDIPKSIKDAEEFERLICGHHYSLHGRDELQGQPKLIGLAGPMFNGYVKLENSSIAVPVIRYEKH